MRPYGFETRRVRNDHWAKCFKRAFYTTPMSRQTRNALMHRRSKMHAGAANTGSARAKVRCKMRLPGLLQVVRDERTCFCAEMWSTCPLCESPWTWDYEADWVDYAGEPGALKVPLISAHVSRRSWR